MTTSSLLQFFSSIRVFVDSGWLYFLQISYFNARFLDCILLQSGGSENVRSLVYNFVPKLRCTLGGTSTADMVDRCLGGRSIVAAKTFVAAEIF